MFWLWPGLGCRNLHPMRPVEYDEQGLNAGWARAQREAGCSWGLAPHRLVYRLIKSFDFTSSPQFRMFPGEIGTPGRGDPPEPDGDIRLPAMRRDRRSGAPPGRHWRV